MDRSQFTNRVFKTPKKPNISTEAESEIWIQVKCDYDKMSIDELIQATNDYQDKLDTRQLNAKRQKDPANYPHTGYLAEQYQDNLDG